MFVVTMAVVESIIAEDIKLRNKYRFRKAWNGEYFLQKAHEILKKESVYDMLIELYTLFCEWFPK